ncbi:MAG: response regulator transcription factor, partial [Lachnospiraceae bacterium]|nr:response regulator transcription factor [Lachnospiraceae bacterium]
SEAEGIAALKNGQISLCLIDITLTSGNGFGVFEAAKQLGIPSIFLTASAEETDAIRALDAGAEDYVEKPFRTRELLSRIRNALRRNEDQKSLIPVGELLVDTKKGTVTKNGQNVDLSALEWRLFLIFLQNRGRLLSRNQLLSDIWDIGGDYVNDNTLTVYIKRLREKLEDDPKEPKLIETVRGLGYRMP